MSTPFYDLASLVVVPSGYKASKVYAQKPLTTDGQLTFSRASTATRVNSAGLIESVASNVPRLDYSGGATCPRLLLEPQRTNLVFPSATATTQTITVTATAHTLSFYGTGSVTLSGVATGTLTGTGANDRVALTFTPTAGSLVLTVSGTITNWQLEAGAYATSYIPTTTASVTRLADACSKTGISSLIGQTEGTIFVEFNTSNVVGISNTVFGLSSGGVSNRIIIFFGLNVSAQVRTAGVVQAAITGPASTANTTFKCALAYNLNDVAFYVNGVLVGTNTSATIPATSDVRFDSGAGAGVCDVPISQALLFKTRLTNAQLAELTAL